MKCMFREIIIVFGNGVLGKLVIFISKKQSEKYYTSFYDTTPPRNDLLDTFRPLENVENGYIRPYAGI